jgi:hypothetical protein
MESMLPPMGKIVTVLCGREKRMLFSLVSPVLFKVKVGMKSQPHTTCQSNSASKKVAALSASSPLRCLLMTNK